MLNKYCSLLTMILALAILLGHNVFPHHHHHHHEEEKELAEHHHDTDSESPKAADLEHLFSALQHTGNEFTFLTRYKPTEKETGKPLSGTEAVSGSFDAPLYPSGTSKNLISISL